MGGTPYSPTPQNLRAPVLDQLVDPGTGIGSVLFQKYLTNLTQLIASLSGIPVVPSGFNITAQLQGAINTAIKQGGGTVVLPFGSYGLDSVSIPAGSPPINIIGEGWATKLTRASNLPPGVGMFDISSSFVSLSDFVIDGAVTTPVGLAYNSGFSTAMGLNDPMAPSLTNNTSIWVHGPATNFTFTRLLPQHSGGYWLILDALTGDVSDIDVLQCWPTNNRPTLFGLIGNPLIYGSYNGGILAKSDGRTSTGSQSGVVSNLIVEGCRFKRNTGNCVWSHGFGFNRFNSNFRYLGNDFLDCGLDGILVDLVSGGCVEGNTMRRVGYTTLTDTDQAIPRWLPGLNATGLDSGVVKGVNYSSNSFQSVNGGAIDLDSHCMGSVSSNICRVPYLDEPEFVEDSIAICGPAGTGNAAYGANLGVTFPQFAEAGSYIDIVGNTFLNLPSGSIRLYSGRYCNVNSNIIQAPDASTVAPISMGPQGPLPANRCFGNKISQNQVYYNPGAPAPVVLENDALSGGNPMTGGEANTICNNNPIGPPGTAAIEFQKAVGSGSVVYSQTDIWFP